jgi:hypothetical protein
LGVDHGEMEPRSARSNFTGAISCGALVLFFSLILLWRDPRAFWIDDYQISILPVFEDVARSWNEGQIPLLSPYSWICGNLAGEYQYGTFSVFINGAVIVIWKIFHGFAHQAAALSILHLVVLSMGAFVLARQRNLSMSLATMVSLVAALNGWIIAWGAPDWFGALGAFAWLPWAWWGMEKTLGAGSAWRFLWPAPFVYLVATGGFPYTLGMLGLLLAWLTIKSLVQTRRFPFAMLFGAALGLGLAAPAILALLNYVHGSARETQPASTHWQWIVPPAALPGLILPSWTVKWADFGTRYLPHIGTELACGLVAPVALLWGLIVRPGPILRRLRWELMLLAIVLAIAMLPTAGLFRWSFRWLPLFHLILALCAVECLALLGQENDENRGPVNRISLPIFCTVLVAVTAAAVKVFGTGSAYFLPLTTILLGITVAWMALEYFLMEGRAPASPASPASPELRPPSKDWLPAIVAFAVLLATYLCIPPNARVPRFNFKESLRDPAPLDPARLYLSIYPPPDFTYRTEAWSQPVGQIVRPGSTSMWGKLRFINGYSPIRPAGVAKLLYASIHGEIDPGTAQSLLSNEGGPDGLLAQLGVDGIVLAKETYFDPGPPDEWEIITSTDEGRVFHRRGPPYATVRSVTSLPSLPNRKFSIAKISGIHESRTRVTADIEVPETGPALITFSRPYFDGYHATFGSEQPPVMAERGLFPVVEISRGSRGRLILQYRPDWLVYGGGLAILCALIWLGSAIASVFPGRNVALPLSPDP